MKNIFVTQLMRFVCCVISVVWRFFCGAKLFGFFYIGTKFRFVGGRGRGRIEEEEKAIGEVRISRGILLIILKASFEKVCSLKQMIFKRVWFDSCNHYCTLSEFYNHNVLFTTIQCWLKNVYFIIIYSILVTFFCPTVNYTKLNEKPSFQKLNALWFCVLCFYIYFHSFFSG